MSAQTVSFVGSLVRQNRSLMSVFEEHLKDQDGEVLPHLFMADVERWAEDALTTSPEAVKRVLVCIEDEYNGPDDDVREVIAASFLEHLPRPGNPCAELRELLGPACTAKLQDFG